MKNTMHNETMKKILLHRTISLLIVLASLGISSSLAQELDKKSLFRITGGLGISTQAAISSGTTISLQNEGHIYSLRVVQRTEAPPLSSPIQPLRSSREVSLLYGIASRASYGYASASCGLGVVDGIQRGEHQGGSHYEKKQYRTVGVPLDCQLFLTPFSFIGIGLSGFANINPAKSYAGVNLCVQIGRL